jgi:3-hydroxybutyrate dehydrogenase
MNDPKNILITGAGSGLGRGLSIELAQAGHRILVTDKRLDAAEETVSLLPGAGGVAYDFDVTCPDEVQRFFVSIADQRIDVLINNAGVQHVEPVDNYPADKWDLLLDVLLKGVFLMTRGALKPMRQKQSGRIVNIGSIHSLVASPFKSAYSAAKHGIVGFAKTVALETGDTDITINTICPAYIRTPLVERQMVELAEGHNIPVEEVARDIMLKPMPKKTFITFGEVAGAVEFFMTDAARNITGQTLAIDGGWTVQ